MGGYRHSTFEPPAPVYEQLAAALDALPNAFPRTSSGVELEILRRIFNADEARLGACMGRVPETAEAVAERAGFEPGIVAGMLKAMAKRGLVWPDFDRAAGSRRYRLAPFIVGIYEAQLEIMDHDLSHLIEHYMDEGGAVGLMGPQPALHRVVPAGGSVAREWILPYEDVVEIVKAGQTFVVRDCVCRVQRGHVSGRCDYPLEMCLTVSPQRRPARPGDISLDQALALIDRAEEAGLVHSVSNVATGLYYICNCCGCCCGLLRALNERGVEGAVARSNYVAAVQNDLCIGCEVCVGRCQVGAIAMVDGIATVDAKRCIGCGLCVTGCAAEAVRLEKLPEAEMIRPPADFAAWEDARLAYRQSHPRED